MRLPDNIIEYFLSAQRTDILYETLTISHPSFSQDYYLVRNARRGLNAKDENSVSQSYQYCPMLLKRSDSNESLEQSITVTIGDVGQIIYAEYELMILENNMNVKPTCVYRSYKSSNLNEPLDIFNLEINNITMNKDGANFQIVAPIVNATGTGERYDTTRFPMLRGFLYA